MSVAQQHIVKKFDDEIEHLRSTVLKMGEIAQRQVEEAVRALVEREMGTAKMVLRREKWLDDLEVAADEILVHVFLTRQPTGPDLRTVLALGRCGRDFERIGDEAQRIAEIALQLDTKSRDYPTAELLVDVGTMGRNGMQRIEDALALIKRPSTARAIELARPEHHIAQEFSAGLRRAVTFVLEDARNVGVVVSLALVLRSLERVGGHSQNIAEHIIFQQRGEDVRHRDVEEIERSLGGLVGPLSERPPPSDEEVR